MGKSQDDGMPWHEVCCAYHADTAECGMCESGHCKVCQPATGFTKIALPTFAELANLRLANLRLAKLGRRDKIINIKIARHTAAMMVEAEQTELAELLQVCKLARRDIVSLRVEYRNEEVLRRLEEVIAKVEGKRQ